MWSLEDVASFIGNKGCTSEATQVCHIRALEAALTYFEDNTRQSSMDDFTFTMCLMLALNIIACATILNMVLYKNL